MTISSGILTIDNLAEDTYIVGETGVKAYLISLDENNNVVVSENNADFVNSSILIDDATTSKYIAYIDLNNNLTIGSNINDILLTSIYYNSIKTQNAVWNKMI